MTTSKNTEKIRVLGIDPGTATVGWAIVEEEKGESKAIAYGHISTEAGRPLVRRIAEICADIEMLIGKYKPHESAIEELFYFKNKKTVISVSQARGAMLLTLTKQKLPIGEYTPLQIKQALTGYGKADKQQMQEMTKNILRLSEIPKPDDTADALAVALCHLQSRRIDALTK